jgi:hypothetical protein
MRETEVFSVREGWAAELGGSQVLLQERRPASPHYLHLSVASLDMGHHHRRSGIQRFNFPVHKSRDGQLGLRETVIKTNTAAGILLLHATVPTGVPRSYEMVLITNKRFWIDFSFFYEISNRF